MKNERLEYLKKKMRNDQILIGTCVWMTDPIVTEQLGALGFDFVWVDGEHSAFSNETIRAHLLAAEASHMAALVRVRDHDPATVKPILEMAPDAVIFPMINTAEEARHAVASCLYPPKGIRGYGPSRANRYGNVPNDEYVRDYEDCFLKIMQIEHVEAVRNLEEILSVDGVDSIVVGPNDLSASLGLLGQYRHPDILALMDEIGMICQKHRMPFGVSLGYDEQNIVDWKQRGATWLEVGMDHSYLDMGARITLTGTRSICESL